MDKKFSILDYLAQVFTVYGITVVLLNGFCLLFGESAQAYSSIFALGGEGLAVVSSYQFLAAIAIIVALRFLFMTDLIIHDMPLIARHVVMFACILITILAFIFSCGWITDHPGAWVLFVVCFAISCATSTGLASYKEKHENKQLEQALRKIKEEP